MAAIGELLAFIDRLETLRDPASSHHARRVSNLTIRFAHDVTTEILDFQELGQAATLFFTSEKVPILLTKKYPL